jgi:hypothetical protein
MRDLTMVRTSNTRKQMNLQLPSEYAPLGYVVMAIMLISCVILLWQIIGLAGALTNLAYLASRYLKSKTPQGSEKRSAIEKFFDPKVD